MGKDSIIIRSPLLGKLPGVVHGFAGKRLGDGRNPATQRKGLKALDLERYELVRMKQVHGADIVRVNGQATQPVCDGIMISETSGKKTAAVLTADCLPVLLADPVKKTVIAAHAGWKGTLACIAAEAVRIMRMHGSMPGDIHVAIGPHIRNCCYIVGQDRADLFSPEYNGFALKKLSDGWHLDLSKVILAQLKLAGIGPERIDISGICTSCNFKTFYSYRKEPKVSYGENISMIALMN